MRPGALAMLSVGLAFLTGCSSTAVPRRAKQSWNGPWVVSGVGSVALGDSVTTIIDALGEPIGPAPIIVWAELPPARVVDSEPYYWKDATGERIAVFLLDDAVQYVKRDP